MSILSIVYSLPFAAGLIVGVGGMKLCMWRWARHEDRVHPLPDGRKHPVPRLSRIWAAGAVLITVLGYVLLQTDQTETRYKNLADSVAQCQREFTEALIRRSEITEYNDELSVRQRNLFADLEELQGAWLARIVSPDNPVIANLDVNDPRRENWAIDVTIVYNERADRLRAKVAEIITEQQRLADERAAHPLSAPSCGQPE